MSETGTANPSIIDRFSPLLALLTVILIFALFIFFVNVVSTPRKETMEACALVTELTAAETRFKQLSTAKKADSDLTTYAAARSERDRLRKLTELVGKSAEEAKERRLMVKDIIMYILGVLSSALMTILGYYFGSSKGSAEKTTTLNAIASKSQQSSIPAAASPVGTAVPEAAKSPTQTAAG